MKKSTYILFIAASILFLAGCLKSGGAPAGPAGSPGATGPAAGALPIIPIGRNLSASNFIVTASPGYSVWYYPFPGYDSAYSYDVEMFLSRISTPAAKEWYRCPVFNLYTGPGPLANADEVFPTIGHDTIYVWYYNPAANPFPIDSVIDCSIYVLPILKKI